MKNFIFISFIAGAALGLGACHDNEFYCENAPQNDCRNLVDGRVDGPVTGCTAAPSKCTGDKPVCDTVTDTCVPCLGNNVEDMSCPAAAPVCSSQACGVCTADVQCTSGACRADGTCSAAANVISVAPGGAGTTCDKNSPCDLTTGVGKISTSKNVLHLAPGNYPVNSGLTLAADVAVVGRGATLDRSAGNAGAVVTTSAKVALEFLTVTGGLGSNGVGVSASLGTLTMVNTKVSSNGGGGVAITNSGFKLVNNVIVLNGGTGSFFGGVKIDQIAAGTTLREMSFNTIANNLGPTGIVTGVACSLVLTACTFSNNIIFDNVVSSGITQTTGNNCSYTYSDIGPGVVVGGTGNLSVGPQFVDVSGGNFHLMGTSPVKDKADPAATLGTDFDGDVRPQGGARDMGADEVKP